jgi:hypothetical protein
MKTGALVFVRKIQNKTILTTIIETEAAKGLKGEHQHLCGIITNPEFTTINILHNTNVDRTEEAHGYGINGILELPIWQN